MSETFPSSNPEAQPTRPNQEQAPTSEDQTMPEQSGQEVVASLENTTTQVSPELESSERLETKVNIDDNDIENSIEQQEAFRQKTREDVGEEAVEKTPVELEGEKPTDNIEEGDTEYKEEVDVHESA